MTTSSGPRRSARVSSRTSANAPNTNTAPAKNQATGQSMTKTRVLRSETAKGTATAEVTESNPSKSNTRLHTMQTARTSTAPYKAIRSSRPKANPGGRTKHVAEDTARHRAELIISIPNAEPNTDNPTSTFHFLDIPIELRTMVYKEALTRGTVNILRACKQIKDEALPLIYSSGWLRINTDTLNRGHLILSNPSNRAERVIRDSIQNVAIDLEIYRIDPNCWKPNGISQVLRPFTGRERRPSRQTCTVTLSKWPANIHRTRTILEIFDGFVNFENVVFTAVGKGSSADLWPAIFFSRPGAIVPIEEVYRVAKEVLSLHYGPEVSDDTMVDGLKFTPLEYQRLTAGGHGLMNG